MSTPRTAFVRALAAAGPLGIALLAGSCGAPVHDATRDHRAGAVTSIAVTTTADAAARGTTTPLDYTALGTTFTFGFEARGANNRPVAGFNGYLALSVTPGRILGVQGPGVLGTYVPVHDGVAAGVQVTVSRAYGEVRLWAEDTGYVPVDPHRVPPPQCADGVDNNHDGLVDYPADPGCVAANDDTEDGGSNAAGTSDAFYFATPLVSDIHGHTTLSPLSGERVTITGAASFAPPVATGPDSRKHRLVVTQTDNSGFFVTDIDDRSCTDAMGQPAACYNSVYAFNFSPPIGIRPCDQLSTLLGSVSEFVSYMELNQPGFQVSVLWRPDAVASVGPCMIPDPVVLTADQVAAGAGPSGAMTFQLSPAAGLEPYQSSLAQVANVRMPTIVGPALAPRIVPPGMPMAAPVPTPMPGATNCDYNHDGRITYNHGDEQTCADGCTANPACTEWSTWARYGQITVTLPDPTSTGTTARIAVNAHDTLPTFNPQHPAGPVATITGTLRQVSSQFVLQPRCQSDFVIMGDGQTVAGCPACTVHANQVCRHDRSVGDDN